MAEAHGVDTLTGGEDNAHPDDRKYIVIALILAVVTGIEVGLYYIEESVLTAPTLLVLAAVKFVLVALYFMHLRFDNKFFTRVFFGGLFLALGVYLVAMFTFGVFID
jgi:cytochrome c oxidase subunit 4